MARAGAILLQGESVALMKRVKQGETYYMFPGGTIEPGEDTEEACIREIKEELGLDVRIERLIAEVIHYNVHQYYFLCTVVGGTFGAGEGEEYNIGKSEARGTHQPVWMGFDEFDGHNIIPACLCGLIREGLLSQCIRILDEGNGRYTRLA